MHTSLPMYSIIPALKTCTAHRQLSESNTPPPPWIRVQWVMSCPAYVRTYVPGSVVFELSTVRMSCKTPVCLCGKGRLDLEQIGRGSNRWNTQMSEELNWLWLQWNMRYTYTHTYVRTSLSTVTERAVGWWWSWSSCSVGVLQLLQFTFSSSERKFSNKGLNLYVSHAKSVQCVVGCQFG